MTTPSLALRNALDRVFMNDANILIQKDASYGSSWKKRGGCGAFMMLARKWDRLEQISSSESPIVVTNDKGANHPPVSQYDIFGIWDKHDREALSDDHIREQIADLRRYLALVEAEMLMRKEADNYQSWKTDVIKQVSTAYDGPAVSHPKPGTGGDNLSDPIVTAGIDVQKDQASMVIQTHKGPGVVDAEVLQGKYDPASMNNPPTTAYDCSVSPTTPNPVQYRLPTSPHSQG
jgi:hypothetical protein